MDFNVWAPRIAPQHINESLTYSHTTWHQGVRQQYKQPAAFQKKALSNT